MESSINYYIEKCENGFSIRRYKNPNNHPIIGVYRSIELSIKGLVRKNKKPGIVHYEENGNLKEVDLSDKSSCLGRVYAKSLKAKIEVDRTEELICRNQKKSAVRNKKGKSSRKKSKQSSRKKKNVQRIKKDCPNHIKQRHSYGYGNGHYTKDQIDKMNATNTDSLSELEVFKYLKESRIKFLNQEFCRLKCYNLKTGKLLPYDFELTDYDIVIEIQGKQHYTTSKDFHRGERELIEQRHRDNLKREFASKLGYKELEIPYDKIWNGEFKNIINQAINE